MERIESAAVSHAAGPGNPDDAFTLYDLKVEVVEGDRPMVCSHRVGDAFRVEGENLVFDEGASFSMYALAALLPLLPAKQRPLQPADWMGTDELIACPDPNCGARFRITRCGVRALHHGACTVVPLPADAGAKEMPAAASEPPAASGSGPFCPAL